MRVLVALVLWLGLCASAGAQPLTDYAITSVTNETPARAGAAVLTNIVIPNPNPSCSQNPSSCYWGQAAQTLSLFALDRNPAELATTQATLTALLQPTGVLQSNSCFGDQTATPFNYGTNLQGDCFHFSVSTLLAEIDYRYGPSGITNAGLETSAQQALLATAFWNWTRFGFCNLAFDDNTALWQPATTYAPLASVVSNGTRYTTLNGGLSGSTGPSGTSPASDNTVTWVAISTSLTSGPAVPMPWAAGATYGALSTVLYGGNTYTTAAGGTAGSTPPTGFASPSDGGVTWTYIQPTSQTIADSENHSLMRDLTCYYAAYLASNPSNNTGISYASSTYPDGSTVQQQLQTMSNRLHQWLTVAGQNGGLIESYSAYTDYTTSVVLFLIDCFPASLDPEVPVLAHQMMDLYWAGWAQAQVQGNFGAGRVRVYANNPNSGAQSTWVTLAVSEEPSQALEWLYFGLGSGMPAVINAPQYLVALLSSYVPAPVVYDIALDPASKGTYAIQSGSRGQSLAGLTAGINWDANQVYHPNLAQTAAAIAQYAWVTPGYVLGAVPVVAPATYATGLLMGIATQNWWAGVTFGTAESAARVAVQAGPTGSNQYTYQGLLAGPSHNAMVVIGGNTPYCNLCSHLDVWISVSLSYVEQDPSGHTGWVCVLGPTGYVGIRAPISTLYPTPYAWGVTTSNGTGTGAAYDLQLPLNYPVVIQAAQIGDYASLSTFCSAVEGRDFNSGSGGFIYNALSFDGLRYDSFAVSPGEVITISANNYNAGGVVNPYVSPSANPSYAWSSLYINQAWGALSTTIAKNSRSLVLNWGL